MTGPRRGRLVVPDRRGRRARWAFGGGLVGASALIAAAIVAVRLAMSIGHLIEANVALIVGIGTVVGLILATRSAKSS